MGQHLSNFADNSEFPDGLDLVAAYSYEQKGDNDLSIAKNEYLRLINADNDNWWYVERVDGQKGYVPSTFVEKRGSLESEESFAGRISRAESEQMVLDKNLTDGAFLVRKRELDPTQYALTVRDCIDGCAPLVVHYMICEGKGDNKRVFLEGRTGEQTFDSIPQLIEYYSDENNTTLCCTLLFAAAKIRSPPLPPTHPPTTPNRCVQIPVDDFMFEKKERMRKEEEEKKQVNPPEKYNIAILQQRLKELINRPVEGFSVGLTEEESLFQWSVVVIGPQNSAYENGVFNAIIEFPYNFPFNTPKMKFIDDLWHPNVGKDGAVGMTRLGSHKKEEGEREEERWMPIHSVESILHAVVTLLTEPNFNSPANKEAAAMYYRDPKEYRKMVTKCVEKSLGM